MPPSRVPPIVTLTTDFGLADHYVGVMKGVILSRCPEARLVDISHDVPSFSIRSAAYAINQAAPYFPPETIHVIVVDPGVGTTRKPLLVEALGQHFIAPDNGVLSMIVARDENANAFEITNRALWLPALSSTFHGRDLFAPVAAALASGKAIPANVGAKLPDIELLSDLEAVEIRPGVWQGVVLSVDRFGNIITNFRVQSFTRIGSSPFTLEAGNRAVTEFRTTFGAASPELCFAYFGSSGYIEIGLNQASAAALLGLSPGDSIYLRL